MLTAIARCRTAALGGHRDQCVRCGYQTTSYNSCRNRHCPKCQTNAREKWLCARQQELLPVGYYHLIFSVPHTLVPLIWQKRKFYSPPCSKPVPPRCSKWGPIPSRLGAEIDFLSILHTWGQTLQTHPHVHCVIPGGGLSPDHRRWISARLRFFLPVKVLSRVFRGKFVALVRRAFRRDELSFHGACRPLASEKAFAAYLRTLFRQDWVVYAKPPFGGPEHVLQYLARYTHRVAISNHRLLSVDERQVTFRWKDYAHRIEHRTMTLSNEEFLRRFLQHVLPKGFPRIRYYGSLTAGAASYFPCAVYCSRGSCPSDLRLPPARPQSGSAPVARGRCAWSNDSRLSRSCTKKADRSRFLTARSDFKPVRFFPSAPRRGCRTCAYTSRIGGFPSRRLAVPPRATLRSAHLRWIFSAPLVLPIIHPATKMIENP